MVKLCKMTTRVGFVVLIALAMVLASSYAPGQVLADDVTAPSLGAAESFAVLGAEAVTNVPTSSIWGDVGLYPAAGSYYEGLTAAEVGGTIYARDATGPAGSVEDPVLLLSAQAANTAAYGVLATAPTTQDLTGTNLGGQTLTPGVYRFTSDALLTGTLTLNVTDDPDAVFIFQIGTALTTATNSSVVMTNAPEGFCNVWWQVGSSATLETYSDFKGNILASASIWLKTGATLEGRALVQTGEVTMDQNEITMPECDTIPSETGILTIFKFNDLNGDGVYNPPEETPLANWHYTITGPEGYSASGYTDDSGLLTLEGLVPGEYTVTETVQDGWNVTTDNPQTVEVPAGDVKIVSFGNQRLPLPPVGGEAYAINAVKLLMPWIVLFTAVLAGAIIVARRRLRSYR